MKPKRLTNDSEIIRKFPISRNPLSCGDGWNAAIDAMEQHRKEKKTKGLTAHERINHIGVGIDHVNELIGEAHNRISKINGRLSRTETYCIDEEIKKLHHAVDKIISQIAVIHNGDTQWQKSVIRDGDAVKIDEGQNYSSITKIK